MTSQPSARRLRKLYYTRLPRCSRIIHQEILLQKDAEDGLELSRNVFVIYV